MRKLAVIGRVAGIALFLGACSVEPIIASFNTGLARGVVANSTERSPTVTADVAGLQADVVCLQEVWFSEDSDAVIAAARKRFPYSHSVDTTTLPGGGGLYAGGANGLILLSRTALTNPSSQVFESTGNRRIVLTASTELPGVGAVNIGCTQLTAILSNVPYPGTVYASWEAEQAAQIAQLIQFVESRASGQPTLLIGDMNTGPAIGTNIIGQVPDNYADFTAAGYTEPYIALGGAASQCTFCADNTINTNTSPELITDHVFTKGVRSVAAARILDRTINITVNGQTALSNLSPHYGIAVQFTK